MALSEEEFLALSELERELVLDQLLLDWLFTVGFPLVPPRESRPGPARWMACPHARRR